MNVKLRLSDVKALIVESLKERDAIMIARALTHAAIDANGRVSSSVDHSAGMLNVFVKLLSGDPDSVETTLINAAERGGWSLLSRSDRDGTTWWFEPNHDTKGHVSVLPKYLWHVTAVKNLPSIMTNGLIPRVRQGGTRRYAPRIYLASSVNIARTSFKDGEFSILKIDTTKLPDDQRFYVDQEFGFDRTGTPRAVYTLRSIPVEAISIESK